MSNPHPERRGDLRVTHPTVAHHQNRRRPARQPTQDSAYIRPSFALDYRVLGARQGSRDLHQQFALVDAVPREAR